MSELGSSLNFSAICVDRYGLQGGNFNHLFVFSRRTYWDVQFQYEKQTIKPRHHVHATQRPLRRRRNRRFGFQFFAHTQSFTTTTVHTDMADGAIALLEIRQQNPAATNRLFHLPCVYCPFYCQWLSEHSRGTRAYWRPLFLIPFFSGNDNRSYLAVLDWRTQRIISSRKESVHSLPFEVHLAGGGGGIFSVFIHYSRKWSSQCSSRRAVCNSDMPWKRWCVWPKTFHGDLSAVNISPIEHHLVFSSAALFCFVVCRCSE